jgi:hypothetical protein
VPRNIPEDPFAHSFLELLDLMDGRKDRVVGLPRRAVEAEAVVYAALESAHTGAPVQVEDIINGTANQYEATVWEARERIESFRVPGLATVECPTGSGQMLTLGEVAAELSRRLSRIFLRADDGRRPVFGGQATFQQDPHWRDLILFHEYFHGDNGAGIGASHQTGWTALVAKLLQQSGEFL